MLENLKRKAWDLIRPIHSPVTRALRRRLGRNYFAHPEMELPPAYEYAQHEVERRLHHYLHVSAEEISQFLIVGADEANEVDRLLEFYPNSRFFCYEPNPPTFDRITRKFGSSPRVKCFQLALGDVPGRTTFYEMDVAGTGSLLRPKVDEWSDFTQINTKGYSSFEVDVSTLDKEAAALPAIDLIWMDVQGAEGLVLAGGRETLKRTKAVFIEVAVVKSAYSGAVLFNEIEAVLQASGFVCVCLGLDPWNATGNALFLRDLSNLVCRRPT